MRLDLTEGLSAAAALAMVSKPITKDISGYPARYMYIYWVNPCSHACMHASIQINRRVITPRG